MYVCVPTGLDVDCACGIVVLGKPHTLGQGHHVKSGVVAETSLASAFHVGSTVVFCGHLTPFVFRITLSAFFCPYFKQPFLDVRK